MIVTSFYVGGKSDMARARGCALPAVLAGTIACWAVAEGVAVAQEAAEVTEDLGSSYLLARRTTNLGSTIETVLFAGEPIVTEIVVPAPDQGAIRTRLSGAVAGEPVEGQRRAACGDFSLSDGRRGRDDRDARVRAE